MNFNLFNLFSITDNKPSLTKNILCSDCYTYKQMLAKNKFLSKDDLNIEYF